MTANTPARMFLRLLIGRKEKFLPGAFVLTVRVAPRMPWGPFFGEVALLTNQRPKQGDKTDWNIDRDLDILTTAVVHAAVLKRARMLSSLQKCFKIELDKSFCHERLVLQLDAIRRWSDNNSNGPLFERPFPFSIPCVPFSITTFSHKTDPQNKKLI